MKNGFLVMDSDFHMMEPDDLWENYLEEQWKAKGTEISLQSSFPRKEQTVAVNNGKPPSFHTDLKAVRTRSHLKERAPMHAVPHYARAVDHGFDPETHVEAMDIEGVDVGVLYEYTWSASYQPRRFRACVCHGSGTGVRQLGSRLLRLQSKTLEARGSVGSP